MSKKIEDFIRNNRNGFNDESPSEYHETRFLIRLANRFKRIISIVPYLVRLFIVTILIFTLSICAWNQWIRKDRHEITLKEKIMNVISIKK